MNCDFIDLKQETINCKGVNLESAFHLSSIVSDGLLGYLATWLPIVLYCVEWATDGLSIVGSPLEASDKSCLNNNWECV